MDAIYMDNVKPLPQRDLEGEVYNARPLVDRAGGQDIHVRARISRRILLCQPPADFDQEGALLPSPLLLQLTSSLTHPLRREVVQHDHIRTSPNRRISLLDTPTLDLDLGGESTRRLRRLHRTRNRSSNRLDGRGILDTTIRRSAVIRTSPDMVILQHCHGAQVVAVRVRTTNEDTVFLNDTEAGCGLACSCEGPLPPVGAERCNHRGALASDAGAAGEDVQGDALAEEDLADGAADGGAVLDWGEGVAFFDVPFDSGVVSLAFGEEGNYRSRTSTLAVKILRRRMALQQQSPIHISFNPNNVSFVSEKSDSPYSSPITGPRPPTRRRQIRRSRSSGSPPQAILR